MKRMVFRLRWNMKIKQWQLLDPKKHVVDLGVAGEYKVVMESRSREYVRNIYTCDRQLTQLVIHNKDGKITKGNGEATYGRDPRRSKG